MKTSHTLAYLSAVTAALALVACGGGGGSDAVASAADAATTPAATTLSQAGMLKYMNDSMGATSDSSAPADISNMALAQDDTSEPASL